METKLFICLALIASSNAGPTWRSSYDDDTSCALECKNNARKFQYAPSTTYIYDYAVDTETTMTGAAEDSAKLSIKTRAEIQSIDGCEFALSLKNTRISHSEAYVRDLKNADREDEFKQVLEGYILRFSFDDGIIASVCPDQSENSWALNFKRGLLSAFQNSMESLDSNQRVTETDITGECEAEYNVSKSWGAWHKDTTVTKSKNLRACTQRDGFKTFFQTTPYNILSDVQSLPVIRSSHKCEQVITSAKLIKSVTCEESHIYVPFSNDRSGGSTKVQLKLSYITQRSSVDAGRSSISSRRGLLFEHSFGAEQAGKKLESATQTLKEICEQSRDDLRPETPRMFAKLVADLRILDSSDLKDLYRQLKTKSLCPENGRTLKFFLDALPMGESEGTVEVMSTLIKNKDVDGLLAKAWITSLALIQNPSIVMIDSALGLLDPEYYDEAVLPVSSLVNNYCKKDSSCGDKSSIDRVVRKLSSNIPRYCNVNDKNAGDVMKTLRAFGNTGRSGIVSSALTSCLSATNAPVEVRAAAADAFRTVPCGDTFDKNDDALWNILKNTNENFELRIFSYLSVMRCPNTNTLNKVTDLLENEKDEQVGSYITSHLNNLKQTSDPHKQDVADSIRKLNYKEFALSALKFSKNFEASFLINKLNLGLVADSDVISSPDSPLPRFAKANLTVDLFGNSINLLEIGGRIEGVEALAEKLLGPYGYFFAGSKDKAKDKQRDLKGFAYARIFGNEMIFQHFSGAESMLKSRKFPNFLDYLIQLADRQEVAYTYSVQFMDVSLVLPTIAGLPLNIAVNGSINLDLKAAGKADLRQVAASPRSLDIDGEIKSSAALEVTGTMSVDALVAKLGLRMRNTMHSSTGVKGRIHINRGRELSVEIEPPRDKMEIFNAKSQFFIVHNEVEKEQEMIKTNSQKYKLCTGSTMAKVFGVEFCGEVQFPNASHKPDAPHFFLAGPIQMNVMSHKRDTHTVYKLYAKRTESKDKSTAQFLINTPGSKINRMISTDITIGYSPKQVDVILDSPWKKLNLNSGLVANRDMYSLVGSALVDDVDKYGLTTEMKMSRKGGSAVFSPLVQSMYKGSSLDLLSGQVEIDTDNFLSLPNKLNVDLKLQSYSGAPYSFKTGFINSNKEKRLSTSLAYGNKDAYSMDIGTAITRKDYRNFQLNPEVTVKTPEATLLSLKSALDFKADNSLTTNMTLNVYKQKPATFALAMGNGLWGKVEMKLKSVPANIDIDVKNNLRKTQKTSSIKVVYNIPSLGAKDTLKVDTKYQDKSSKSLTKYLMTSKLNHQRYSDYNLDLSVNIEHKGQGSLADATVKYGADSNNRKKSVNLKYNLLMKSFDLMKTDFDFQVSALAPEKNINSYLKLEHNHDDNELASSLKLRLLPYMRNNVTASISLKDNSKSLTKMEGKANLELLGKSYRLMTDLSQKTTDQFIYTADFMGSSANKYSLSSVYNRKKDAHEVTADVSLSGLNPIKFRGNVSLGSPNYGTSFTAIYGIDEYGFSVATKFIENRMGKLDLALVHPDRQIVAAGEASILKDNYKGSASINWNAAEKNTKQQISVQGTFVNSLKGDVASINGDVKIKVPFSEYEEFNPKITLNSNAKQASSMARMSWGKNLSKKASTTLTVFYPVSMNNLKMSLSADSPFNIFRDFNIELDHSLDTSLATTVKGKLNDDKVEVSLTAENKGNSYTNDLSTSLSLKTTVASYSDISLVLAHTDDSKKYQSTGTLSYNGEKYQTALTMSHDLRGSSMNNNGNLKISWPQDSVEASWRHENTDTRRMKCSLTTKWGGSKSIFLSFDGDNYLARDNRVVKGNLDIQTPWREAQSLKLVLNHQHDSMRLTHKFNIQKNFVDYGSYEYLLETTAGSVNTKFAVKAPNQPLVHGQTTVNYDSFPASSSLWFEWSPASRVDFEGTVNAPSIEMMELETKLSTPFRNFENVVVKSSHKLEGSEYVSIVSVDYAVRKQIELTNRVQYDNDLIAWRTTFVSPCRYFRSLNYGLRLEMDEGRFDGSADFELVPIVKKYDGRLTWIVDSDDYDGKFVVNTPHKSLPNLQIVSWRKVQDDGSKAAHVDVYSAPYGKYAFDTTYKTQAPYSLDMQLRTPHINYETMGLTFTHNPTSDSVQSRLEAVYLSKKEIVVDLNLNWQNKIVGNLLVNTPVEFYENNKISITHETTRQGFNCIGEVIIGKANFKGDASFARTSSMVTGSTNIRLPFVRKIEGKFTVTGSLKDLKSDASLKLGQYTLSTDISNTMRPGFYRSSFKLNTPYTEALNVEFQHNDKSGRSEKKFDTSLTGQYGDKDMTGKLSVVCSGLKNGQFDFTLKTPFDGFESLNVNLNHEITGDKIYARSTVTSTVDSLGNIDATISKQGAMENLALSAVLVKNGESLVDASAQNKWQDDEVQGKLNIKGKWVPTLTFLLDHNGIVTNFNTKIRLSVNNKIIVDNEVAAKIEDKVADISGKLNYVLGSEDHKHSINIHKDGDLNNFVVTVNKNCDGEEVKVNFELQTDSKFRNVLHIENALKGLDFIGYELDHSGDFDKFLTNVKVFMSKTDIISGRTNFFKYSDMRVEFESELITPFNGYKNSKIEYRHEGQNNRASCNLNFKFGDKAFSSDLIIQREPSMSFSFNLKTPYRDYEQLLLSSDFDGKMFTSHIILGRGIEVKATGISGSQYELTTSFNSLKQVTININGQEMNRGVDLIVIANGKKITGNVDSIYTSADSMSISATLDSDINSMEKLKFVVKKGNEGARGKTYHAELSWDTDKQVVVDGRYSTKNSLRSSQKEHEFELDIALPLEKVSQIGFDISGNYLDQRMMASKLGLELNKIKILDMDVSYRKDDEQKASVIFRKPWPQEYTVTLDLEDDSSDIDIALNWNKNLPTSNIRITSSASGPSKDKKISCEVTYMSRAVGIEHSYRESSAGLTNSGKVYWDDKDDTRIMYSISRNGGNGGEFKLGLPSRTLVLKGSSSVVSGTQKVDATFGWDMDRDESKVIGLTASMYNQEYTKANINVKLPSYFQVNSAVILNQGDIIFDGKTDFSYASDARKTLTFFSVVKNMPTNSIRIFQGSNPAYNYSVELGVKHPETKVDIKVDSHLGKSANLITSSMGLRYMTSTRQIKNLALFAAINQLKKEINLVAASPFNTMSLNGKVVVDEPLNVELAASVNGQQNFKSAIDTAGKSVKFQIGQPGNMVIIGARYLNTTSIRFDIDQLNDNSKTPEAALTFTLAKPRLLQSSLIWKPSAVSDLKIWLAQQAVQKAEDIKAAVRQLNSDIRNELLAKNRDITSYLIDTLKDTIKDFETQLEALATSMEKVQYNLGTLSREAYASNFIRAIRPELQILIRSYKSAYPYTINSVLTKMDEAKQYSLARDYKEIVTDRVESGLTTLDGLARTFAQLVQKKVDLSMLKPISDKLTKYSDYLEAQFDNIQKAVMNFDLGDILAKKLSFLNDYKKAVKRIQEQMINKVVPEQLKETLRLIFSELIHQAAYFSRYLEIEANLKKHVNFAVHLVNEIAVDELKEFIGDFKEMLKDPVVAFEPENGRVILNIPLPLDLERLDKMPEITDSLDNASKLIQKYIPDQNSMSNIYQYVINNNNVSKTDDILSDLNNFEPRTRRIPFARVSRKI